MSTGGVSRSRPRRLALTLWISAVTAATAACSGTVDGAAAPATTPGGTVEIFEQVDPPELGTCLDTVRGGAGPLGPPATLSCSDPHGGEIARVLEVPDVLDGEYPTDEVLDSDAWGSLLYGSEGCGDFQLPHAYLGARDRDNLLVDAHAYLPKKSAWGAGARWVACAVEYRLGITDDLNAPGRMAQAMRGPDRDAYRECWFGPELVFSVVPCSQPHEAEPTGDYVSAEPGTPYPDNPLSRQPLVDACTAEVVDYLEGDIPDGYAAGVYLPSAEEWAAFPEVRCVIVDSAGRRTSGSAVDA